MNSEIKDNSFEVAENETQRNIMNLACSPMISLVANKSQNFTDMANLHKTDDSPKIKDDIKHFNRLRLIEELVVVGISPEIKENIRTFPTNAPVEIRPKLLYSYSESEKS